MDWGLMDLTASSWIVCTRKSFQEVILISSYFMEPHFPSTLVSPWYNRHGWLDVKYQVLSFHLSLPHSQVSIMDNLVQPVSLVHPVQDSRCWPLHRLVQKPLHIGGGGGGGEIAVCTYPCNKNGLQVITPTPLVHNPSVFTPNQITACMPVH